MIIQKTLKEYIISNNIRNIEKNLKCTECEIYYQDNKVFKIYNSKYYKFNKQYNRRGEIYYLTNYHSEFFPKIIDVKSDGIVMENHGIPVNLKSNEINFFKLVNWLCQLKIELKNLGLEHRDIYWRNVLYDKNKDRFTLIDFCWMIKIGDPNGPETRYPKLNPFGKSDNESINKFCTDAIYNLIRKIAEKEKIPGSSTRPGWIYHPIPFLEWKVDIHKKAAINEFEIVQKNIKLKELKLKILDIGSSVGYFSFNFSKLGHCVTAVEADSKVFQVAEAIRVYKNIQNLKFYNSYFNRKFFSTLKENYDVILMLNVHMWIYKKEGPEETKKLLEEICLRTKKFFFQTSHAESGGLYKVNELKTVSSVQKYLESCGFKNVILIQNTSVHGGIRSLFLCDGKI